MLASTNYVNEELNHARKDSFKEFARGDVYLKIGGNSYSAKVIVGFTGNDMVLYDVVDIQPAHFDTKKDSAKANSQRDTLEAAESSSETPVSNNSISQTDENVNPSDKSDSRTSKDDNKRYSLARKDSEGKVLSQGQRDYFKDSKAVDEEGGLLRVYHGSKASPTVFSSDFISAGWLAFGKGFYFTEDKTRAQRYGKSSLYECYLNIKNPFISNDRAHLDLLYEKMNTTRDSILKYAKEKGVGGGELFKINYYLDDRGDDVSTRSTCPRQRSI